LSEWLHVFDRWETMAFKLEIKDHSNKYQYVTRENGVPGINIGAMK